MHKSEIGSIINEDTHVYCLDCKHGSQLVHNIRYDRDVPEECLGCNPYNLEDSMRYVDRPNFKEK